MADIVHVPAHFLDRFVGIDDEDCLVIEEDYGALTTLTPCCDAYGKGSDYEIICRACYGAVAAKHAGGGTIAVPRAELEVIAVPDTGSDAGS
ncbi:MULTISPECIES: hypothetical protein [Nocardia]|uniref:Uncharacterized protein n=1 Tax=Nocardia africana TaxID=134964 RepID=A0A378X507_9NOCA|nr:hypothetical protein [Nocardia africana]MCC3317917.1 hypothetical protein [Nocardia africana]SUA48690.1 Uncharacterised protein [Nocardia africana]